MPGGDIYQHMKPDLTETDADTQVEPAVRTIVRRVKDATRWFVPMDDNKRMKDVFDSGLMTDVVFNPKAVVMPDIWCLSGRISEATATGVLTDINDDVTMPEDARLTYEVDYDIVRKVFHAKGKPECVFSKCDYLVLIDDGSSIAGWKTEHIPAD